MAAQVYQPQPRPREDNQMMGQALPLAGGALGSILGPAGSAVGTMGGGLIAKETASPEAPAHSGVQTTGAKPMAMPEAESPATAVARRQQQLKDANQLQEAYAAVENDPKMKKEFGPMLLSARDRAMYGA